MRNLALIVTSLAMFTGCVVGSADESLHLEGETDEPPEAGSPDEDAEDAEDLGELHALDDAPHLQGADAPELTEINAARYLCGNAGGVVIWEHAYFQGRTAVLCHGDYPNLEREVQHLGWFESWNDRIRSLQFFGNVGGTLYRHSEYRDPIDRVGRNGSRLDSIAGISSIEMYSTTATSDRGHWRCAYGGIVIFEHENWSGRATVLCGGQYQMPSIALGNSNWNDRINGIITFGGRRATFYSNVNFAGHTWTARSNATHNLRTCPYGRFDNWVCGNVNGAPGWGDLISSIKVHY